MLIEEQVATFDGQTLERHYHLDLRPHSKVWPGKPDLNFPTHSDILQDFKGAMTFYRPDLHSELKRLCLLQSSEYKLPKLLLGSEVISVVSLPFFSFRRHCLTIQDINKATVTLANGSSLSGDLIMGADGERVGTPPQAFHEKTNHGVSQP